MPSTRARSIIVSLANIGAGEVNTLPKLSPSSLLPRGEPFVSGPLSPGARNLRLIDGSATPRLGYKSFGDHPTTSAVTGLFLAQFDNAATEMLRGDGAGVRYYNAGAWTDTTAAGTGGYWAFTMARRAGGTTVANQVIMSGNGDGDLVYRYYGAGGAGLASIISASYKGPQAIVYHRGRCLYLNVYDVGAGARKTSRVAYSIVGDPTNVTGTGAGFVDLDDDPYPLGHGLVINGNIVVFRGNNVGGSIVVGTATGNPFSPYRWDTLNTNNVGLLCPRLVVPITPNVVFYLGHDDFYLYDGGRTPVRVPSGIARDVLSRINYNSLRGAFGWYKPDTGEIKFGIPTGSSTYPTEYWTYHVTERRFYGPDSFRDTLCSAGAYATTGTLTWDTLAGASWDTLPYTSWDTMGPTASSRSMILGDSNGFTWEQDGVTLTDNGGDVTYTYQTGAVRADGRVYSLNGSAAQLGPDDVLTLQDLTLVGVNTGSWTPTVQVSTDGTNTWTTVSDGTAMGGSTLAGRSIRKNYTTNLTGYEFLVRVFGSGNYSLQTIQLEFTHGGSARAGID